MQLVLGPQYNIDYFFLRGKYLMSTGRVIELQMKLDGEGRHE